MSCEILFSITVTEILCKYRREGERRVLLSIISKPAFPENNKKCCCGMCLVAVFWLLFLKTGHKNAKFGPQKTNCIQKLNRVRIGLIAEGRRGVGLRGGGLNHILEILLRGKLAYLLREQEKHEKKINV